MNWIYAHLLVVLGAGLAVVAAGHMLSQRRTPQSAWAWLIAMFAVPWVAVPVYLMFGGRKMGRLADSKNDIALPESGDAGHEDSRVHEVLRSLGIPAATNNSAFQLHANGEIAFVELLGLIAAAKERIRVETFVFATDETGRAVLEALVERAEAGVDVEILIDGVGSLHLRSRAFADLRAAGGKLAWFMPVLHRPFRGRTNLRTHRKLVIVDGTWLWSGGRNLAVEYMGARPEAERWVDLSFTATGPIAAACEHVFNSDWQFAAGGRPRKVSPLPAGTGDAILQAVPSGPDVPNDALLSGLLTAVYAAEHRIHAVTPYFVPPESLVDALCLAARRGVEVTVILPERSNHRLADLARTPGLETVREAGGRILVHPRMVHAKAVVVDSSVAFFGSANIDERSLLLNYEMMFAAYSAGEIDEVAAWVSQLEGHCRPWTREGSRVRRLAESLAEPLAPLL